MHEKFSGGNSYTEDGHWMPNFNKPPLSGAFTQKNIKMLKCQNNTMLKYVLIKTNKTNLQIASSVARSNLPNNYTQSD
jgi:hypothetical protein